MNQSTCSEVVPTDPSEPPSAKAAVKQLQVNEKIMAGQSAGTRGMSDSGARDKSVLELH